MSIKVTIGGGYLDKSIPTTELPPLTIRTMSRHALIAILARIVETVHSYPNLSGSAARLVLQLEKTAKDVFSARYAQPFDAISLNASNEQAALAYEREKNAFKLGSICDQVDQLLETANLAFELNVDVKGFTQDAVRDIVESVELVAGPRLLICVKNLTNELLKNVSVHTQNGWKYL